MGLTGEPSSEPKSPGVRKLSVKSQTSSESDLRNYAKSLESNLKNLPKPYLDAESERTLLEKGAALGLSSNGAERCLLLICEKQGIAVERMLRSVFNRRVTAAVGDRLLDELERKELERQGHEIFAHAEDPAMITKQLLEEVQRAEHALSEADVKAVLAQRVKQGALLSQGDWDDLRRGALQELQRARVDRNENDRGEILERAREEHGVKIQPPSNFPLMMAWMLFVAAAVFVIGKFVLHI
jgi:hypothetical protein